MIVGHDAYYFKRLTFAYYELDNLDSVYTMKLMNPYVFEWNEDKNALLKSKIGLCFEDVVIAIQSGKRLSDEPHFNQKDYPHQRLLIVEINHDACIVPYIIDEENGVLFLKTIYKSRKYTRIYFSNQPES